MEQSVNKAYDKCLRCKYLGDGCDGPNTLSMSLEHWCEWCHDLKNHRGYSNAYIAEVSGVSLATVNRIMAKNVSKDIMRSTSSDINRALIGSENTWPCSLTLEESLPDAIKELKRKDAELERLRDELAEIHKSYKLEMDIIRHDAQKKIDYLKLENERKQNIITRLMAKTTL